MSHLAKNSVVAALLEDDAQAVLSVEEKSVPRANLQKPRDGVVVEYPGFEIGMWRRWYFPTGGDPMLLKPEEPLPPQSQLIVVLPSKRLFAWPLWIAAEGESNELVRLELSGRYLLKQGMEESLVVTPVVRVGERLLVLAVAVEEPFLTEGMTKEWKSAARFELPSRLMRMSTPCDLLLWHEWGSLQVAWYREGKPIWFCVAPLDGLSGFLHRAALRFLSEGVLLHFPSTIAIRGLLGEQESLCTAELRKAFPRARIFPIPIKDDDVPPSLPGDFFDLPPAEAREQRFRTKQRKRIFSYLLIGALVYVFLLFLLGIDFFVQHQELKKIQQEIARVKPLAMDEKKQLDRWHVLRRAVDPTTYPLDLLAAIAAPTEGGKVRLTRFLFEQGHLQISGEATDISQAYNFIEQLKKTPLLQEYDWNAGQPQLAGKSSVRFEMEGTRSHANDGAK